MLILSRKAGERVLVPHCALEVTVVAIDGNTVRLGFRAPAAVVIYREELWLREHPPEGTNAASPAAAAGDDAGLRGRAAGVRPQPPRKRYARRRRGRASAPAPQVP